jgi:hypothetical protein
MARSRSGGRPVLATEMRTTKGSRDGKHEAGGGERGVVLSREAGSMYLCWREAGRGA